MGTSPAYAPTRTLKNRAAEVIVFLCQAALTGKKGRKLTAISFMAGRFCL